MRSSGPCCSSSSSASSSRSSTVRIDSSRPIATVTPLGLWIGFVRPTDTLGGRLALGGGLACFSLVMSGFERLLGFSETLAELTKAGPVAALAEIEPTAAALLAGVSCAFMRTGGSEELLIRGLLYRRLIQWFGAGPANLIQALFFTLVHNGIIVLAMPDAALWLHVDVFVRIFVLSWVVGWYMERRDSGSLLMPRICHGIANLLIFHSISLTYAPSKHRRGALVGPRDIEAVLADQAIAYHALRRARMGIGTRKPREFNRGPRGVRIGLADGVERRRHSVRIRVRGGRSTARLHGAGGSGVHEIVHAPLTRRRALRTRSNDHLIASLQSWTPVVPRPRSSVPHAPPTHLRSGANQRCKPTRMNPKSTGPPIVPQSTNVGSPEAHATPSPRSIPAMPAMS
jgi:membrane protease YdiL (CAAX protease family)